MSMTTMYAYAAAIAAAVVILSGLFINLTLRGQQFSNFFSLKFQLNAIKILCRRLNPKEDEYTSPFQGHIPLEYTIAPIVCVTLAFACLSAGLARDSVLLFAVGVLALGGFAALVVMTVADRAGDKIVIENLDHKIFIACVFIGISAGIFTGAIGFKSMQVAVIVSALGLAAGYAAGMLAGLWVNFFGFLGWLISYALVAACAGLAVADLLFIYTLFNR